MSQAAPFTAEEIAKLRTLLEVEEIKKVKLLYSQLMDSRDVDALIEIFTEDALCEFGPYGTWHGREAIQENYRKIFRDRAPYSGFHATTNQWVEIITPTTAVSRTYLQDTNHEPDPRTNPVIWYGLYDEDYEKIDGAWKDKAVHVAVSVAEATSYGQLARPISTVRGKWLAMSHRLGKNPIGQRFPIVVLLPDSVYA